MEFIKAGPLTEEEKAEAEKIYSWSKNEVPSINIAT
jgi:hypothetical protein